MTDAINPHNRPRNSAISSDAGTNKPAAGKQSTPANSASQSNPASIVELSNSGIFHNIGEQIDKLPEINEVRVASIKQSLAQGEYKPDAEVIAKKFSEIEKLLP